MKIVRKLGQSRELAGVDREVERPVHDVNVRYSISCIQYLVIPVHDVDVAPLGVKGDSRISRPLPGCFHVG